MEMGQDMGHSAVAYAAMFLLCSIIPSIAAGRSFLR